MGSYAIKGYVPTLDGWRGVAISGVLVCHGMTNLFRPEGRFPDARVHALASLGAYGVQIFFGLSGFLITFRLIEEERNRGRISLTGFYLRRIFRILPVSFAYLAAVGVLQVAGLISIEPASWLASLLFYKNLVPDKTWYLSHFWSLSQEEQFYLFWPALLVTFAMPRGMVLAALLGLVSAGLYHWLGWIRFDVLLAGCAMAFVVTNESMARTCARILRAPAWPALCLVFLAGMLKKVPGFDWWMPLAIALLIAGTAMNPQAFPGRILEWKPLKWLGRISYSVYIWQELFCVEGLWPSTFGRLQTFPVNIFASFALAMASYYLLEKPLIRIGHRVAARAAGLAEESAPGIQPC